MSTPMSYPWLESSEKPRKKRAPWLREPFLHFIVLGALLFAVDHVLVARADDPRTIVVGPEVDSEAVEVFKETRGREPTEKELHALHQIWLDNEVLYREGLALELDRGDTAIRERVIFKMLSVVEANLKLPAIDDKQLAAWFEKHREKYDEPARYSFQEAVLADRSESAAREFVDKLNAGHAGDTHAGLRVFKDRPLANLVQSYGADFPKTLETAPAGVWQAVKTHDGWHAMRLDAITPPRAAQFDVLRGVVLQDWTDATAAELRTQAVRTMAKKYTVEFAPSEHGHPE